MNEKDLEKIMEKNFDKNFAKNKDLQQRSLWKKTWKPYFELPVYKKIYDLNLFIYKAVLDLPRLAKYSTWQKILNIFDEVWIWIFKINSTHTSDPNKKKYFLEARENIELLKYNFRILKDMNFISLKNFVKISEDLENISIQVSSWQKYFWN